MEPKNPARRSCGQYDWQVNCFVCGKEWQNQETYQRCETLLTYSTILKMFDNRGDAEALAVKRQMMKSRNWYKSRNKNAEEDLKPIAVTAAGLIVNVSTSFYNFRR